MTRLPARVVHLNEWRWLLGTLRADFATRSLAHGAEFVTDVTATLQGEATVPVLQLNRDRAPITLRDPNGRVSPAARSHSPSESARWPHGMG